MLHHEQRKTSFSRFVDLNRRGYVTDRDLELLRLLHKFKFMSASQIRQLFFRTIQTCGHRLQRLYNYGILDRFMPAKEYIYCIDTLGAHFLAQDLDCSFSELGWQKRHTEYNLLFLYHYLETVDTYFELRKLNIQRLEVNIDLKHIRPDMYLEIINKGYRYYFFIEVDRATERQAKILKKMKGYEAYYRQSPVKPILVFRAPDEARVKQLNKWLNGKYTVTTNIYEAVCKCLDGL